MSRYMRKFERVDLDDAELAEEITALVTGISPSKQRSILRTGEVAWARFLLFHLLVVKMGHARKAVARRYSRDHTAVMHALRRCDDLCYSDKMCRQQRENAEAILSNALA